MTKNRRLFRGLAIGVIAWFILVPGVNLPAWAEVSPPGVKILPGKIGQDVAAGTAGLVDLDLEDADIRDALKGLARVGGVNIVVGEDVEAQVTLRLEKVSWERALDIILRTYNFTYKKEENLIRVMTFGKVREEEKEIPLITKIVYVNFADVNALRTTLTKMLSGRGSMEIDQRTNSMIVTDIPSKVEEVENIAQKLDTRTPQVLIEAMLVDVKLTEDDELGINWKIVSANRPADQGASPNYIEQPADPIGTISSAAVKFGFLKEIGGLDISGLISAWMQESRANILASPKIVTLDNQTAKIEIKSQVAYTQITQSDQGGSTTSTQFKDVVTGLEVTPHVTKDGFISMNVKPRQEFVEATINGEPQIGSRSAETNVLVRDGQTIVIGGLRKVEDNLTIVKVPILGDIPIIGSLFRKKDLQKISTELVMFVTPYIIVSPKLSDEEVVKYEMLDRAREGFLKKQEKEKKEGLNREKNEREQEE